MNNWGNKTVERNRERKKGRNKQSKKETKKEKKKSGGMDKYPVDNSWAKSSARKRDNCSATTFSTNGRGVGGGGGGGGGGGCLSRLLPVASFLHLKEDTNSRLVTCLWVQSYGAGVVRK